MKICLLVPCLMKDNNRKANMECLKYAMDNYAVDEIVVFNQEFEEEDLIDGITYLNPVHTPRCGFVNTRNALLKWFYDSDYDYALWMDANSKVSKSSLNDLDTLLEATRQGALKVDVVLSTLGIIVSGDRILAKQNENYFRKIYLIPVGNGNDWMHAMLMINFKKHKNIEPMIVEDAEPRKAGMTEDVFFVRLLRKIASVRLCPTICVTKAGVKTSTWAASDTGKYDYPVNSYDIVNRAVANYIAKKKFIVPVIREATAYSFDRTERFQELLKPYKARQKKKPKGSLLK